MRSHLDMHIQPTIMQISSLNLEIHSIYVYQVNYQVISEGVILKALSGYYNLFSCSVSF